MDRTDQSDRSKKIDSGEKREKAAALVYDQIGAPRVVAKGMGNLARKMIETARTEGIPIQKNEILVEALLKVELTTEIPPQLYQAVAEILSFVYRLDKLEHLERKKFK